MYLDIFVVLIINLSELWNWYGHVIRPAWVSSTHVEASPSPVKGFNLILTLGTSSGLTLTQGHWEQSVLGCANAYHDTGNLVLRYHLKFPDFYTYCLLIYVWLYLFSNWEISEISVLAPGKYIIYKPAVILNLKIIKILFKWGV